MRKIPIIITILLISLQCAAQIAVAYKIDTTKASSLELYKFINSYMSKDTISNELWHPKYKNKPSWNYNIDWIWGRYTPKKITTLFDVELVELQKVNDSLSYFKISAKSKPEKMGEDFINIYKYYVVKLNDKYFLDNCMEYDRVRFKMYKTKNINFYVSPFYPIEIDKMKDADYQLEKLNTQLKRPPLKKSIDYYMCSTEEELNNLSNIVIWNGGLGGYTNIPESFIVAINSNPNYKHEFVHAILGSSANCFFLQEGMASLYGGMDKGLKSYEQGIAELKKCYASDVCNFNNLYAREVKQQYNSSLTYTFAAACCKFLIDNYGLAYFYKIYYNKEITTTNFMEKISGITGKSQKEIREGIEKLILQN